MRIIKAEKIEDCFDGSRIFLYSFEDCWNEVEINKLQKLGKLEYFRDFPRPFFRLITKDGMQVKGVEGDVSCRVIFPSDEQNVIKQAFEEFFVS